jgi:TonB family protein
MLEFVVGTAGKVEPASVRVVESSHPAFESAAREAVIGARFQPARLRSLPVRQITRQRVRFVAKY